MCQSVCATLCYKGKLGKYSKLELQNERKLLFCNCFVTNTGGEHDILHRKRWHNSHHKKVAYRERYAPFYFFFLLNNTSYCYTILPKHSTTTSHFLTLSHTFSHPFSFKPSLNRRIKPIFLIEVESINTGGFIL